MNYKIILDKRRSRQDHKYPLKIRTFEGRKYKDKALGIFVTEEEWDLNSQTIRSTCDKHKLFNSKLTQEKAIADKRVLFGIEPTIRQKPKDKHSIIAYGRKLSQDFEKTGKTGNSIIYNTAIEMILRYTKKKDVLFEDIDYSFLMAFQNDLLKRGVGVNTISIYLRTIRATINKAINEELTENYPFKKFKIRQQPTPSRSLTIEELRKIVNYPCSGDREFNRDLFLLSFCLIGINLSDLLTLTKDNLIDGRVIFSRKKTHKVYSLLLHPQAKALIEKWQTKGKSKFLLPVLSPDFEGMVLKKKTQQAIHICNNYLRKIAKELGITKCVSSYYARFSWANIARSLGYSKDLIAEALGHEYGNKVTGIYLDCYDKVIIDAANKAVLELILGTC